MKLRELVGAGALALLTACGGGGGNDNNNDATEFSATLDMAQEVPAAVVGVELQIGFTNNAPANGTFQTPVWFGIHNGTFDTYDRSANANLFNGDALERLAEDGTTGPMATAFLGTGFGRHEGTIPGPNGPIAPGESGMTTVRVDPNAPTSRYFSYVSMVIPSNDAFIANGGPMAHALFDAGGNFVFNGFTVLGDEVLDAGTEVNDELPANTAFFGQAAPNTGGDEAGTVELHPGFMMAGSGGILDDAMFGAANFLAANYETLAFSIAVSNPSPAAATGTATFTLQADGVTLAYNITASNLSGPLVGAHFHEGAAGVNGPVVFNIGANIVQNGGDATIQGTIVLTAEQLATLRARNYYVNLHTMLNPGGEIRGQISANG